MSGFTLVNLTVKDGKFEDRDLIKNEMARIKDGTYHFILKPSSNKISEKQKNWWFVLAKLYKEASKGFGNTLTELEANQEMLTRFIPNEGDNIDRVVKLMKCKYGLYEDVLGIVAFRSIRDLTKGEFVDLYELINKKWIEDFGVPAPEPWLGWRKDFE